MASSYSLCRALFCDLLYSSFGSSLCRRDLYGRIDVPVSFDKEFDRVVQWAADNRAAIHEKVKSVFGETELLLDRPHNTYEQLADGGVIIRKGSVRLLPGEF